VHALCTSRGAGSDRDWIDSGLVGIESGIDWVLACYYIASIVIHKVMHIDALQA
jgi:hypothetical protein